MQGVFVPKPRGSSGVGSGVENMTGRVGSGGVGRFSYLAGRNGFVPCLDQAHEKAALVVIYFAGPA